ncbi:MAG: hypothetical protein H6710_05385 [Myxococcales bacterium]|nr:hypothetical protein [Myxococcales bacterium]MCB9704367.1 hypothetical protein [Myxococcales bacterium]
MHRSGIDAALDYLFDRVDRWLCAESYSLCDEAIEGVDPRAFPEEILVGLLSITFPAKKSLASRMAFLDAVEVELTRRIGAIETQRALRGLG